MGPIFIGGCDRSGTTMLRLMLTQSPELHIPGETTFLPIMKDRAEEYGDFSISWQRWFFVRDLMTFPATTRNNSFEVFELTPEEAEQAIAAAAPTDYPGAGGAVFAAAARKKGKSRWGDKSPANVMYLDYLAEAFPAARFVHIIRDARDACASIRRAGWMHNFRTAAATWKLRIETGQRLGAQLGDKKYREIRYEALVLEPEKELRALCEWLELDYTTAMIEFHKNSMDNLPKQVQHLFTKANKPADTSRVEAWKKSMPRKDIADVEFVAGDLMEKLGYSLTGVRIAPWTRLVRAFFDRLRSIAMKGADYSKRLG